MFSKKAFISVFLFLMLLSLSNYGKSIKVPREQYSSPYSVEYSFTIDDLVGDIVDSPRGAVSIQAAIPYDEWYSSKTLSRYGSWGPRSRHYSKPSAMDSWSVEKCRERVIAVGLLFKGYPYQHHHIPDWEHPESWPWKPVSSGKRGKGLDCSNFTSFVYNLAFGLKFTSDVSKQSAIGDATGPGPGTNKWIVKRIPLPEKYEDQIKVLRTGDLVFSFKKGSKSIGHAFIWVGRIGKSPDDTPLFLDSGGGATPDCNGIYVPDGVYLRPYRKKYWPYTHVSHAIRFFYSKENRKNLSTE